MSIDKAFYHNIMKNMFADPCEVKYWDGEVKKYGDGETCFKICFNDIIAKSEIISDPSLAFGEGYMHNKIDIDGSVQKVIESIYNNYSSFLHDKNLMLNWQKYYPILFVKAKMMFSFIMIQVMISMAYGWMIP